MPRKRGKSVSNWGTRGRRRASDDTVRRPRVTGFFTVREFHSRLTVSDLKHTEGTDVFA